MGLALSGTPGGRAAHPAPSRAAGHEIHALAHARQA